MLTSGLPARGAIAYVSENGHSTTDSCGLWKTPLSNGAPIDIIHPSSPFGLCSARAS